MPVFGEYETLGEPVAVTEERGHTSRVWQARLAGSKDGRLFAIKCYQPRPQQPKPGETEHLQKDRSLEFLEAVKQLKKAHSEGGRCLSPIHAFGIAPEGAWYVTDFYPGKTLKELIVRRGRVDSAALRHVVRSVVAGCLALKRSRGYSHGNLKAGNVFLVGKPRALSQRPIQLGDPYPASVTQLAGLEDQDRKAVGELLNQTVEAQDLRAVGELLLQLVRGRLIANAFDFDYPIARSPAWDNLGKEGETWRELCNQLLSPQLSLQTVNLESLDKKFQPTIEPAKLRLIGAVAGGVILVGVALFLAVGMRSRAKEKEFQQYLQGAQQALSVTNLVEARKEIERALKVRPGDSTAQALKGNIEAQTDTAYNWSYLAAQRAFPTNAAVVSQEVERALQLKPDGKLVKDLQESLTTFQSASEALDKGDFEAAEKQSTAVLASWPKDPTTLAMLAKAQAGKTAKANYDAAIAASGDALTKGNFYEAERQANNALKMRAGDAAAQALLTRTRDARDNQEKSAFDIAMRASQEALVKENFSEAEAQANNALKARPAESTAQAMLTKIRDAKTTKEKFEQAMKAGQDALGKDDDEAEKQANLALKLRPGHTEAKALLTKVQQDRMQKGNYEASIKAAQDALTKENFEDAERQANNALTVRPGDATAQGALAKAREGKANKVKFDTALKAAQDALTKANYDQVEQQANDALKIRPGDTAAQALVSKARDLRASQGKFDAALKAAQDALARSNFGEAELQATNALKIHPDDATAKGVLARAHEARATQENFASAVKAAQDALGRENYDEAEFQATNALRMRPTDANVQALVTKVRDGRASKETFSTAIKTGQDALAKENFDDAERQANAALKLRPEDATAKSLLSSATVGRTNKEKFGAAMKAAQDALAKENFSNAELQANEALKLRPADKAAQALLTKAREARATKEAYDAALSGAQDALAKENFDQAEKLASSALKARPGDAAAQAMLTKAQEARTTKANFETAQKAAQDALAKGNYDEAERQAMAALKVRTNDVPLQTVLTKARDGKLTKAKYDAALKAAQDAVGAENYAEAEKQADLAVKARPGDSTAQALLTNARENRIKREKLDSALKSARDALQIGDQETAFSWATNAVAVSGNGSKVALALLQTITTNACNDAIKIMDGDAAARWLSRSTNAQVPADVMAVFAKAIVILPAWPAQLADFHGITFVKVGKSPTAGKIFYASKYEVTASQFKDLASASAPAPGEMPATCDSQASADFCDKLNKELPQECGKLGLKGGTIKLPSKDEYFVMAQIGSELMDNQQQYHVSNDAFTRIQKSGEVVGQGTFGKVRPAVPGQATNSFGLVNVIGNIPEWSDDGKVLGLTYCGSTGGAGRRFVNNEPIVNTDVGFRPILIPQ
jgi:tetratricopeptide (TPR) repeat protein